MAASSASILAIVVGLPETGLRPEPQGACTLAAGAALKFDVEPETRDRCGKTVFDRHSTQSSIAARQRRVSKRFRVLPVDTAVYSVAEAVYQTAQLDAQVPEYVRRMLSTVARVPFEVTTR